MTNPRLIGTRLLPPCISVCLPGASKVKTAFRWRTLTQKRVNPSGLGTKMGGGFATGCLRVQLLPEEAWFAPRVLLFLGGMGQGVHYHP